MVATDYPSADRAGTMAAARLHQQLGLRQQIEAAGGNVDIFATIHALDLPLLVRPLQGLLGAYLSDPGPGVQRKCPSDAIAGALGFLPPEQYAYRPGRNAQQAVVKVEGLLFRAHPEVVDADLADYLDTAS